MSSENKPESEAPSPAEVPPQPSAEASPQPPAESSSQPPQAEAPPQSSTEEAEEKIFTTEELFQFNGTDPEKPIYIGVHGVVFDVSSKRDMYAPGQSYHVFAGRDATRALAKMALDIVSMLPYGKVDDLDEKEMKTMIEWKEFYAKRYKVVGKVQPAAKI